MRNHIGVVPLHGSYCCDALRCVVERSAVYRAPARGAVRRSATRCGARFALERTAARGGAAAPQQAVRFSGHIFSETSLMINCSVSAAQSHSCVLKPI